MLSLENANVPAAINTSKPNRTSGRRVKLNVRSPLSRDCLRIRAWRRYSTQKGLEPDAPGRRPIKLNGRQFLSCLEVQIGRQPVILIGVYRNARRGTGLTRSAITEWFHEAWQRFADVGLGHSRPGRADSKTGPVRYAPKAEANSEHERR